MKQVLLGTEGNQPFKIKASGVSRNHARITIDDEGIWKLEDLNSTNGTFIREENGELRRIVETQIEEMTFICLGPDNVNGCSFYARRILSPENYTKEFEYLNDVENVYDIKEVQTEKMAKYIRLIIFIVSLLCIIISFISLSGDSKLILLRVGSMITGASSILFDPNSKKKKNTQERKKMHHCPNPECSHILSTNEIRNMQCSKCKAK